MSFTRIRHRWPDWAPALRCALRDGYRHQDFLKDLRAGVSVGVTALPVVLVLAIATGVAPQHGLYAAAIAGLIAPLAGGSRYTITGPTAAFAVILHPIAAAHGLAGLLIATMMAGVMLVALGYSGMGRLIAYVPYPVMAGFNAGIAIVIAGLQLQDFLGIHVSALPEHFLARMQALANALPSLHAQELAVGVATLALVSLWPKLKTPVPAFLVGTIFTGFLAFVLRHFWPQWPVTTLADRYGGLFDGGLRAGIALPLIEWPWHRFGANDLSPPVSVTLLRDLLGPACAIALLGALQSLRCAAAADRNTGSMHNADAELVGQGLGNLIAPLFAGIPAAGAQAGTFANIRAGARTPLAAAIHALVVLLAALLLAPLLAWLPMSGLSALLLVLAWNISGREKFLRIFRIAPRSDVLLLLFSLAITVFISATIAIAIGVVLAALLFMHRMAQVSHVTQVGAGQLRAPLGLPAYARYYTINGPLFFAAAAQATEALKIDDDRVRAVILDLVAVPSIDVTGLVALEGVIDKLNQAGIFVAICSAQSPVLRVLRDAGYLKQEGRLWYYASVPAAIRRLHEPGLKSAIPPATL